MKSYNPPKKVIYYNPPQAVINKLTILVSRGITDISREEIRNSTFYQETQTATFLSISSTLLLLPEVLLLIAQITAASPTICTVSMNNLHERGQEIAKILATSSTICTVNINDHEGEYGPLIAEALTKSPVIRVVNMTGANLTEQTTNVFIRHNDGYFDAISTVAQNLNLFMPEALAKLIRTYFISSSFIKYDINNHNYRMHGDYEDSLSCDNTDVRRFDDGNGGSIWHCGSIWHSIKLNEGDHSYQRLIGHTRSEEEKSAPIEATNTNNTINHNNEASNIQAQQQGATQELFSISNFLYGTMFLGTLMVSTYLLGESSANADKFLGDFSIWDLFSK